MKKYLLIMIVLLAVTLSVGAQKKVYIERIGGHDSLLVNRSSTYLSEWIETAGGRIVQSKEEADLLLRLNVVSSNFNRSFNWVIVILPLWPFVPFTTPNADVVLSLSILTPDGRDHYSSQAGANASAFLFGDFMSEGKMKDKAFIEAFNRLTVSAHL